MKSNAKSSPRRGRAGSASSSTSSAPGMAHHDDPDFAEMQHPRSKKDPWTTEEDELLLKLVDELGNRWRDIAMTINSHYGFAKRIGKQCRERYLNHLKGGLKNTPWTPEEDELLRQNQKIYGNKWASIAAAMDGRPENQVKNRWNAANFNKHSPSTPKQQPQHPIEEKQKRMRMSLGEKQMQQRSSTAPPPPPPPFSLSGKPLPPPQQQQQQQPMNFQPPPLQWMPPFAPSPAMLFPHYFAQQQQRAQIFPPPTQQQQQRPSAMFLPSLQNPPAPLFAPLVDALEKNAPAAVKEMCTPPASFAPPTPLGVSPPSSCYDLFEALKTDTEQKSSAHSSSSNTT